MKKRKYKKGLMYHRYNFGLLQNIKVWICRRFGHEVNSKVENKWCERCGLFYGEIYHKQEDWAKHI